MSNTTSSPAGRKRSRACELSCPNFHCLSMVKAVKTGLICDGEGCGKRAVQGTSGWWTCPWAVCDYDICDTCAIATVTPTTGTRTWENSPTSFPTSPPIQNAHAADASVARALPLGDESKAAGGSEDDDSDDDDEENIVVASLARNFNAAGSAPRQHDGPPPGFCKRPRALHAT